jgi:hypothetical protein
MSEPGFRFLERLYPRTFFKAAVHAAGKVACEVHDNAVGRVGVYHLFRLPETIETGVYRLLPHKEDVFAPSFRTALGHPDKLLELLAACFDVGGVKNHSAGANRIGTDRDLLTKKGLDLIAGVYHRAFLQSKPSFPYFTMEHPGGL